MYIKSFDGTEINYKIKRKEKLFLIFLHGWANNWTTWKKEINFFRKKGYSTLTLDLRGHGRSDKPDEREAYNLEFFAKDIHEIIKKENINEFVLVGHSMGGMIALTYFGLFRKENHVKGIVLCNSTYRNILEHKRIKVLSPFIKHVIDFIIDNPKLNKKLFGKKGDIDLTKYAGASDYLVFYKGLHNVSMKSVFGCLEEMLNADMDDILKKIKVPVLILQSKGDKLLPKQDSIELYHEIKDAELEFIPKAKHFANIESPELVQKHIFNFLKSHDI